MDLKRLSIGPSNLASKLYIPCTIKIKWILYLFVFEKIRVVLKISGVSYIGVIFSYFHEQNKFKIRVF